MILVKKISLFIKESVILITSLLITLLTSWSLLDNMLDIVQILISIFGISITSYVFVIPCLRKLIDRTKKKTDIESKILELNNELQSDMKWLLVSAVLIVIISIINLTDIIILKDIETINIMFFSISSLKAFVLELISYCIIINDISACYDYTSTIFSMISDIYLTKD
jgi:hypothetical protein